MISNYADGLFESQIMYVKLLTISLNLQLQNEIQKYAVMISTLNHFQSKISAGLVKPNPLYRATNLFMDLLYDQKEDPELMQIYYKKKYGTSIWLHQNVSKVSELSQVGQEIIRNATLANPLQRAYQYLSETDALRNSKNLQITNVVSGFSAEGIFYANGRNSTYRYAKLSNCTKGPYVLDVKCLFWFRLSKNEISLFTSQPEFNSNNKVQTLISGLCQKLNRYNSTTQLDETYMVLCIPMFLDKLQIFFQNFINQTKQSFIIEPRSQSILYNSEQPGGQTKKELFYEKELKYVKDTNQSTILNNTIVKNYGKWIYNNMSRTNLKDMVDTQANLIIQQSFQKNDTKYIVMLNPLVLYDKLPQFKGVVSNQPKGFRTEIMYLQINYISDEDLRAQTNELKSKVNKYFIYLSVILIVFSVLSILITIFYTLRLNKRLEEPIDHLTKILVKMNIEIKSQDLFNIYNNFKNNQRDMFHSKETHSLFQSFETIFQMLIYTSENFFNENQTTTLLRLYQKIEFFRQFKNNYAVGIIHNNIGCILLNKGHHFQALEHFSSSILYAQYEIQDYIKEQNDTNNTSYLMNTFCFPDNSFPSAGQQEKDKAYTNFSFPKKASTFSIANNEKRKRTVATPKQGYQQNEKQEDLTNNKSFQSDRINVNEDNNLSNQTNQINIERQQQLQQDHCLSNVQLINQDKQHADNYQASYQFQKEKVKQLSQDTTQQKQQILHENEMKETPKKNQINIHRSYVLLTGQNEKLSQNLNTINQDQLYSLLLNVYFRKKNYILALISFQEAQDKLVVQKHQQTYISYNFWVEIKFLLNQLLQMIQTSEISDSERVELLSLISKCYINLKKTEKSTIALNQCQALGQIILQNDLDFKEIREKGSTSNKNSRLTIWNNQQKISQLPPLVQQDKAFSFNVKAYQQNPKASFQQDKESFFQQRQKQNSTAPNNIEQDQTNKKQQKNQLALIQNQRQDQNIHFCQRLFSLLFFKKKSNPQPQNVQFRSSQNLSKYTNNENKNQLESVFENLRKITEYQSNLQDRNQFQQIVSLALADNLITKQQFFEAASILTELFENTKALYSHLPFQIVTKLKSVFEEAQIYSRELNKMRQKFNKSINMRISFVIGSQENKQQYYIESLKLLSNIMSLTTIKEKDQIGIIYYNQQEDIIQTYMEMINVHQIKDLISSSIQEIYSLLSNDPYSNTQNYIQNALETPSKQQHSNQNLKIFQSKNQPLNYNILVSPPKEKYLQVQNPSFNYDKSLLDMNLQSEYEKNNDIYSQRRLQQEENQNKQNQTTTFLFSQESKSNLIIPKSTVLFEKQQSLQNKLFMPLSEQTETTQRVESAQLLTPKRINFNEYNYVNKIDFNPKSANKIEKKEQRVYNQSIEFLQTESDEQMLKQNNNQQIETLIQHMNERKQQIKNQKNNQKFEQFIFPELIGDEESILFESDKNIQLQQQDPNKDYIFHMAIRKSIHQFITGQQFLKFQQKDNIYSISKENDSSSTFKDFNLEIQRKFIVYVADEISIKQNFLFNKMCECLNKLDITLIILSFQRGNNFIEQSNQGTFLFKEVETIKIFYSIENVQNYLNSQRNSISNHIYPTYIQHF